MIPINEIIRKSTPIPHVFVRWIRCQELCSIRIDENAAKYAGCTLIYCENKQVDVENHEIENISLLIPYLQFAEKLLGKGDCIPYVGSDSCIRHVQYSPADVEAIIDFCKQYGMPIFIPYEIDSSHIYLGFSVEDFISEMDMLYRRYVLWYQMHYNSKDAPDVVPDSIKKAYQDDDIFKKDKKYLYTVALCNIPHNADNILLQLAFDKKWQPIEEYHLRSPLDLMHMLLTHIIAAGDSYFDGMAVAVCQDCGGRYIKSRRNMMYCEHCRGNTGKSRRYRNNMKLQEADQHGKA